VRIKEFTKLDRQFAFSILNLNAYSMAKIVFVKSQVELEWSDDEDSILELAEANDLDLDYGCRMGNCTACQHRVVSGAVDYPMGHTGEPDPEHALLCCCVPSGPDDVIIEA